MQKIEELVRQADSIQDKLTRAQQYYALAEVLFNFNNLVDCDMREIEKARNSLQNRQFHLVRESLANGILGLSGLAWKLGNAVLSIPFSEFPAPGMDQYTAVLLDMEDLPSDKLDDADVYKKISDLVVQTITNIASVLTEQQQAHLHIDPSALEILHTAINSTDNIDDLTGILTSVFTGYPNFESNQEYIVSLANILAKLIIKARGQGFTGALDIVASIRPYMHQEAMQNFTAETALSPLDMLPESEIANTDHTSTALTKNIPFPFIEKGFKTIFNSIKEKLASIRPVSTIDVYKRENLTASLMRAIGKIRGDYFNLYRGWLVPEIDVDRHDVDERTTHVVLRLGETDAPGYCRVLHISPSKLLDIEHMDVEEIIEVLQGLDVMPFPSPEYYELNTDVRELAKSNTEIAQIIAQPTVHMDVDMNNHYPSTSEQVANKLLGEMAVEPEQQNPIVKQFMDFLSGKSKSRLTIIERLMPPTLDISKDEVHIKKSLLSMVTMVLLMSEAAKEGFLSGETLWLLQTDKDFRQHLTNMFGETALYEMARIAQVKRNTKEEGVYMEDDCITILLDIRLALKNVLEADDTDDSFGMYVIRTVNEINPAIAQELIDHWNNSHENQLSLAEGSNTQYDNGVLIPES